MDAPPPLIPRPLHVHSLPDYCALPPHTVIACQGEHAPGIARYLAGFLEALGLHVGLQTAGDAAIGGASTETALPKGPRIMLAHEPGSVEALAGLPHADEGYELTVTEAGVAVSALAPHGLFNGVVSLLQLLPAAAPLDAHIALDCLHVVDAPRFAWRGVLLDVGRHFFPVPFILKVLDVCAFYKITRFHWHLTEDQARPGAAGRLPGVEKCQRAQGWRLEIKAYPKLTEKGAWRGGNADGSGKYGGFYTQEQVREVVEYAAQRFITVVPEIELPGHCRAALACYTHLSCLDDAQMETVPTRWGVHADVYCAACALRPGKEEVFHFLETVLLEVLQLFPSSYIHIGGDECPKDRWQKCALCQARLREQGLEDEYVLQSWFVGRVNAFLRGRGRQLVGWDEILEGGLSPGAIVMSWRGVSGGVRAAQAGHEVIMTPTSHCYFDYRQSMQSDEPGAWYACLPLETVLSFDPVPPPPPLPPRSPVPPSRSPTDAGAHFNDAGSAAGSSAARQASMDDLLGAAHLGFPGGRLNAVPSGHLSSNPSGTLLEPEAAVLSPPRSPAPPGDGFDTLKPYIPALRGAAESRGGAAEEATGMEGDGDEFVGPPPPPPPLPPPRSPPPPPPPRSPAPREQGVDARGSGARADAAGETALASSGGGGGGPGDMADDDDGGLGADYEDGPHLGLGFPRSERSGAAAMSLSGAASASRGPAPMSVSGPASSVADSGDGGGATLAVCNGHELSSAMAAGPGRAGANGPGALRADPSGDVSIDSQGLAEAGGVLGPGPQANGFDPSPHSDMGPADSGDAMAAASGGGEAELGLGLGYAGDGADDSGAADGDGSDERASEPGAVLEPEFASNIIGGQANLWTEYIADEETVEYMLLPRLAALAEAVWSPPPPPGAPPPLPGFLARLRAQLPHLDARGFRYRPLG